MLNSIKFVGKCIVGTFVAFLTLIAILFALTFWSAFEAADDCAVDGVVTQSCTSTNL